MEARCVRLEYVPPTTNPQRRPMLMLHLEQAGQSMSVDIAPIMRQHLGMIREAKLRALNATMPPVVEVVRLQLKDVESYSVLPAELGHWAMQAEELHTQDQLFRLPR
jgi:hypothetical protein